MILPNVIIAGAPKCGTSSLFNWLSDHPEVSVSIKKETRFFIDKGYPLFDKNANYNIHGLAKYEEFFKADNKDSVKVVLEATPDYLYQQTALEIVPGLKPCPKILFILRKPSDRVYSVYKYALNNMAVLNKDITFKDYISIISDKTNTMFNKRPIVGGAIKNSRYVEYISKWTDRVSKKNIRVLLFEDLCENPKAFMEDFSQHIGIRCGFWKDYPFTVKNKSFLVRNQMLHKHVRTLVELLPFIRNTPLKTMYARLNTKELQHKTEEEQMILEKLDKEFMPYNDRLANMFNIDLSIWE